MTNIFYRISEHSFFQNGILWLIVFNAIIMGLETWALLLSTYGHVLKLINGLVQAIFVAEITIRILAWGSRWHSFFRDGWNLFDFLIVMASLLPVAGPFATVARLARVLRIVRLISVSPDLKLIVNTMLRSIPSMGHVVLLLSILMYVYAIVGYYLFHLEDPLHWATLGTVFLSLFQMLTLEGWVEMQRAVIEAYPWAWVYFSSFVFIAVFVVINLFIAVVINNLQTVKSENKDIKDGQAELLAKIAQLRVQLDAVEVELRKTK
jgi:voltage-gated sodium channel